MIGKKVYVVVRTSRFAWWWHVLQSYRLWHHVAWWTTACLRNVSKDGDCSFELVVPTYHFAWCHYPKDYNMKVNIVLAFAGSQCILYTAWNDFHPNTRFMRGQLLFGTLKSGCDSVYDWETWWSVLAARWITISAKYFLPKPRTIQDMAQLEYTHGRRFQKKYPT
jgi:hypothetical protein